jgi:hypothetical protein
MKIYQYNFVGTHLKHCDTKDVNNISDWGGIYFMFMKNEWNSIKNIKCLNYMCLTDGFYSLRELEEGELKKLEDNFREMFR